MKRLSFWLLCGGVAPFMLVTACGGTAFQLTEAPDGGSSSGGSSGGGSSGSGSGGSSSGGSSSGSSSSGGSSSGGSSSGGSSSGGSSSGGSSSGSSSSGSSSGSSSSGSSSGGKDAGSDAGIGSLFACGPTLVCDGRVKYCSIALGGVVSLDGGGPSASYSCVLIPAKCATDHTCACIAPSGVVGQSCSASDGDVTVTQQGV